MYWFAKFGKKLVSRESVKRRFFWWQVTGISQSKVKKMRKLCIHPKIFLPHLWPGSTVKMRQNTYFIPPFKLYSLCTTYIVLLFKILPVHIPVAEAQQTVQASRLDIRYFADPIFYFLALLVLAIRLFRDKHTFCQ